jgi:hypothetical protein
VEENVTIWICEPGVTDKESRWVASGLEIEKYHLLTLRYCIYVQYIVVKACKDLDLGIQPEKHLVKSIAATAEDHSWFTIEHFRILIDENKIRQLTVFSS